MGSRSESPVALSACALSFNVAAAIVLEFTKFLRFVTAYSQTFSTVQEAFHGISDIHLAE